MHTYGYSHPRKGGIYILIFFNNNCGLTYLQFYNTKQCIAQKQLHQQCQRTMAIIQNELRSMDSMRFDDHIDHAHTPHTYREDRDRKIETNHCDIMFK